MSLKIDVLLDVKTTLGEGPIWDEVQQRLYFVDSIDGRVFRCTVEGTELRAWKVPGQIGSMTLRKDGTGAVVALDCGFHTLDFNTGECVLISDPETGKKENRFNDGKTDRQGRFFAGTMNVTERKKAGALYRLDPDFSITKLEDSIVCSNGPCFSPDSKIFYFHDTWNDAIWAYDYDIKTGAISNRRNFAKIDFGKSGRADGSTVDSDGYLWNALVFDGKIIRYAPDGSINQIIEMPVERVTSICFGGPNMDILFATSATSPAAAKDKSNIALCGSLFTIKGLGVRGVPEPRFGA